MKQVINKLENIVFGPMELSSNFVFSTRQHVHCLVPPNPIMPGHVIILPKRRVHNYSELNFGEIYDMGISIKYLTRMLEDSFETDSTTVYIQNYSEEVGSEQMGHVHVHIIPRKEKDLQNNNDIYNFIDGFDKE